MIVVLAVCVLIMGIGHANIACLYLTAAFYVKTREYNVLYDRKPKDARITELFFVNL